MLGRSVSSTLLARLVDWRVLKHMNGRHSTRQDGPLHGGGAAGGDGEGCVIQNNALMHAWMDEVAFSNTPNQHLHPTLTISQCSCLYVNITWGATGATESKEAMEQLKEQLDGWRDAVTKTDKCVVALHTHSSIHPSVSVRRIA